MDNVVKYTHVRCMCCSTKIGDRDWIISERPIDKNEQGLMVVEDGEYDFAYCNSCRNRNLHIEEMIDINMFSDGSIIEILKQERQLDCDLFTITNL